jgi:Uma2 family endonuclease
MSTLLAPPDVWKDLPDHTQLPDKDGALVTNSQEHPQGRLLTDPFEVELVRLRPDGQYFIGRDCGIYWWATKPPLLGCKAPDWYYVPGVPPTLQGLPRRSFVIWNEGAHPLIAIEYVSGDGSEERDRTPQSGKFWVYEQGIGIPYYAIYEVDPGRVEVYHLLHSRYELLSANERGHFPIAPLGLELGIWQGSFEKMELPWLRWWDAQGHLLLTSAERAEQERLAKEEAQLLAEQQRLAKEEAQHRIEQERLAKEEAQRRAQRLAERLRALGIDPEAP